LLYRARRPRAPLDAFVECVWVCRDDRRPDALERVLPSASAQPIVNLPEDQTRVYDPDRSYRCVTSPGTVFGGARTAYQVIDSEQENVAGVVFKPGAIRAFVRVPAYETTNVDVPLEALWGLRETARLRERLLESGDSPEAALDALEAALLARWTPTPLHPAVAFAVSMFDRVPETASVAEVTRHVGLSRSDSSNDSKPTSASLRSDTAGFVASSARWRVITAESPSIGLLSRSMADTSIRRISFTISGRSRASRPTEYQAHRTSFPNHVKFLQDDAPPSQALSAHE